MDFLSCLQLVGACSKFKLRLFIYIHLATATTQ